ncbi:hypothetical protein ANN_22347 [Periplaneta americana]|uniref:Uncharacterized protein n=1 Tax=Periplaneta americana TaxID=6978 RepID=A0ABQ8S7W8_PERAM|nr:hypothetical protein ANN_22347 [Periplaneta americana]
MLPQPSSQTFTITGATFTTTVAQNVSTAVTAKSHHDLPRKHLSQLSLHAHQCRRHKRFPQPTPQRVTTSIAANSCHNRRCMQTTAFAANIYHNRRRSYHNRRRKRLPHPSPQFPQPSPHSITITVTILQTITTAVTANSYHNRHCKVTTIFTS